MSTSRRPPATRLVNCTQQANNASCLLRNVYLDAAGRLVAVAHEHASVDRSLDSMPPELSAAGIGSHRWFLPRRKLATMAAASATQQKGVTLFFECWWSHNVGHALYDGLYPAFVGLLRLGVWLGHDGIQPVHLLVQYDDRFGPPTPLFTAFLNSFSNGAGVEVMPRLAHSNKKVSHERVVRRYDWFVVGSTHMGQRSMNADLTLPGGEFALPPFRDRAWSVFRLPPPVGTSGPIQLRVFDNKRYDSPSLSAIDTTLAAIKRRSVDGHRPVEVEFVRWRKYPTMREQLALVRATDVYVSGPGTGLIFSTFLADGSVVVNLGTPTTHGKPLVSYMEEYLVASMRGRITGLFYDRCRGTKFLASLQSNRLLPLLLRAVASVGRGTGDNHSPVARAFLALFRGRPTPPRADASTWPCDWPELFIYADRHDACDVMLEAYGIAASTLRAHRNAFGITC